MVELAEALADAELELAAVLSALGRVMTTRASLEYAGHCQFVQATLFL